MTGQHHRSLTLKDIREAHDWKREYEKYLPISRFIFRPLGFFLTWLAVRLRLTTETVSWLSGIVGIAGCLLLVAGKVNLLPVGLALLILFNLLDCVDGSIARSMKTENPYGRFLDSLCGGIVDLAFWAVIAIMAFRHEYLLSCPNPFGYGSFFWLALGGATCYLSFLLVYAERTFDELLRPDWDQIQLEKTTRTATPSADHKRNRSSATSDEPSLKKILRILNNNFRVRETHYVLLISAFILRIIDIFFLIFFIYYLIKIFVLIVAYVSRGRIIKNRY